MIDKIFGFFYGLYFVGANRWSWYKLRKADGYPISLWRAYFGSFPRFGCYEENEPGCPEDAKRDYNIVKDSADLT
jgi:hypothetical protein